MLSYWQENWQTMLQETQQHLVMVLMSVGLALYWAWDAQRCHCFNRLQ